MSDLPKWIQECENSNKLYRALAVAWDALQRIDKGQPKRFIAKNAMRRIEELGE
jgi:hypothetical protein